MEKFTDCKNDTERWKWVLANKGKYILYLDNDDMYLLFDGEPDDNVGQFDEYLGWSDGIFTLLKVLGIEAESV